MGLGRQFRGKAARNLIILIAVILVIGGSAGGYLYVRHQETRDDVMPPIIKKMIALNDDIKRTTIDIYNASGKLDSLSMVQSRITDIQSTIEVIANMRQLAVENQEAIDRLIAFIEDHAEYVHRKNLAWVFAIREFYTNDHVIAQHQSRERYFAAFETLLTYTHTNFQNIMELKSQQHMKSYDVYYLRYRRAADNHNRFNKKRIEFQRAFVEEHPDVMPFLPGTHHLEPFKFWDKFSF